MTVSRGIPHVSVSYCLSMPTSPTVGCTEVVGFLNKTARSFDYSFPNDEPVFDMKPLHALALLACLATSAIADPFSYSFTFDESTIVTGTFDGVANGNTITNIADATVLLNGDSIGAIDRIEGFSIPNTWGPTAPGLATVSFDGTANNFVFAVDAYWQNGELAYLSYPGWSGVAFTGGETDRFTQVNSSWSVVAIPEPTTFTLVLGGLALAIVAVRRIAKTDR